MNHRQHGTHAPPATKTTAQHTATHIHTTSGSGINDTGQVTANLNTFEVDTSTS